MALKIQSTPILKGKAAKYFLESLDDSKKKKVSKEEAEKVKAFASSILAKAEL